MARRDLRAPARPSADDTDDDGREHPLAFCEGRGTPFERLYDLDAHTLLVGVGFDRCTSLHFAESLAPNRRTKVMRMLAEVDGRRAARGRGGAG